MNKIASPRELLAELNAIHAYASTGTPSRAALASRLRGVADRLEGEPVTAADGDTWTVYVYNGALRSGHFVGTFDSEEEAVDYAEKDAARSRKFVEYEVFTGTPKRQGKSTGKKFKGKH